MSFDVPKTAFVNNITFRFSDTSTHDCHSNILTYYAAQMPLPISPLASSSNVSAPNKTITVTGGIGPYTVLVNGITATLNNNNQITVNQSATVTITDSVGCQVSA